MRFAVQLPPSVNLLPTSEVGALMAMAPDGTSMVFVGADADGNRRQRRQELGIGRQVLAVQRDLLSCRGRPRTIAPRRGLPHERLHAFGEDGTPRSPADRSDSE